MNIVNLKYFGNKTRVLLFTFKIACYSIGKDNLSLYAKCYNCVFLLDWKKDLQAILLLGYFTDK